jgi:hypothetical protein
MNILGSQSEMKEQRVEIGISMTNVFVLCSNLKTKNYWVGVKQQSHTYSLKNATIVTYWILRVYVPEDTLF